MTGTVVEMPDLVLVATLLWCYPSLFVAFLNVPLDGIKVSTVLKKERGERNE